MKFQAEDLVYLPDGRIGMVEEEIYENIYRVNTYPNDFIICRNSKLLYICTFREAVEKATQNVKSRKHSK